MSEMPTPESVGGDPASAGEETGAPWPWFFFFGVVLMHGVIIMPGMTFLLRDVLQFDKQLMLDIPSSISGLVHSTVVNVLCFKILLDLPAFSQKLPNSAAVQRGFAWSAGFFVADTVYLLYSHIDGWELYIGHHIAALSVYFYTAYNGFGGWIISAMILAGELSNGALNGHLLIEKMALEPSLAGITIIPQLQALDVLYVKPFFMCLFLFLRVLAAPGLLFFIVYYCLLVPNGRYSNHTSPTDQKLLLPLTLVLLWVLVTVGILFGSYGFVFDNMDWFGPWVGPEKQTILAVIKLVHTIILFPVVMRILTLLGVQTGKWGFFVWAVCIAFSLPCAWFLADGIFASL